MTMSQGIRETLKKNDVEPVLVDALVAIADVAASLSESISLGALTGGFDIEVGHNVDGDCQKALDIEADETFAEALKAAGVRWYASEERDAIEVLDPDGSLAIAIDPLDGSSNINTNVSIGSIFSIFDTRETAENSILRPGREQLAAGYVIYGPQTSLLLTLGNGVLAFILDRRSGAFLFVDDRISIPASANEYAINASNYRHWSEVIRSYIDDCMAGEDGPRGRNFNMRWVASLVAETHRIMMRGGIFLYPADDRPGYQSGRLRLVYECAPIAFLVEQAGGGATDGQIPILDLTPETLHQRTPFVFGSSEKVSRVAAYHDLRSNDLHPLFAQRGFFST